jgi:hypothetical protein
MTCIRHLLITIGMLQSLSVSQALASIVLAREPQVERSADGKPGFALADEASAVIFGQSKNELKTSVFSKSAKRCGLEETEILERLSNELDDPVLWKTLAQAFDHPLEKAKALKFTVMVTALEKSRHTFASFFLNEHPDLHQPVIVLDCSSQGIRYWHASLAHELVHLFLARNEQSNKSTRPAWIEEMIAQQMEDDEGGEIPALKINQWASLLGDQGLDGKVPSFNSNESPFSQPAQYRMTYLMGSYLRAKFGGWESLHALVDAWGIADLKTCFSCPIQDNLKARGFSGELVAKATDVDLIRGFSLALILNRSTFDFYSLMGWPIRLQSVVLPRWSGAQSQKLELGAFSIYQLDSNLLVGIEPGQIDPSYEAYFVRTSANRFQIRSISEGPFANDWGSFDTLLVINTGAKRPN